MYIVVSLSYIELGEQGASAQVVDSLGNKGGNIAISLCPFIDWLVVLYRS